MKTTKWASDWLAGDELLAGLELIRPRGVLRWEFQARCFLTVKYGTGLYQLIRVSFASFIIPARDCGKDAGKASASPEKRPMYRFLIAERR